MAVDVKAFVRRQLAQFTVGFWVWVGSATALALIAILLCVKIVFSGSSLTWQALNTGQRVIITIANGDIDGNARHTKHSEEPKAPILSSASSLQSPIISKEGLAPAPLATITEDSDKGLLPITSSDGTVPWKYYARPYTPPQPRHPMVAIILTNLGLSKSLTTDVLQLPHTMTLSFSPYANDARVWARQAREEGFESLVDLPMQPQNYPVSDPGPYGLLDNTGAEENSKRLHWTLSRFPGFVGVLAPTDEKLTANPTFMEPTLIELAGRGVLFLYLKTPQNAQLPDLLKSHKIYMLGVDEELDSEISQDAIEAKLQTLVDLAKKNGSAIAIAHSYPPTVDALTAWAAGLAAQGIDLVPVSAIARQAYP